MPGNFPKLNRETFVSILPRFSTKFSLVSNFVKDFATLLIDRLPKVFPQISNIAKTSKDF